MNIEQIFKQAIADMLGVKPEQIEFVGENTVLQQVQGNPPPDGEYEAQYRFRGLELHIQVKCPPFNRFYGWSFSADPEPTHIKFLQEQDFILLSLAGTARFYAPAKVKVTGGVATFIVAGEVVPLATMQDE